MKRPLLILDANVLIDFIQVDADLIRLLADHVGPVFIPLQIIMEVKGLDESVCSNMGATIVEPTFEELFEASDQQPRRLSIQDSLCLVLARKNGWTCVTNDIALRKNCEASHVPICWELEAISKIYKTGALSREKAIEYGRAIYACNLGYITETILNRFEASLS